MKRPKQIKLLFSIIIMFIVVGCNKDDSNNNPDLFNNIPSNFEVTISEITSNSAILDWTVPTTDEPTTIVYSIFLNESLLVENLSENTYDLSELDDATNYSVKVTATNEFGTSQSTTSFTTTEISELLLKKYNYNNGQSLNIEYDNNHQITRKYVFENLETSYSYVNGKIISEDYHHPVSGTLEADYTYGANQELTELMTKETTEYANITCTYNFQSDTSYTYTRVSRVDYDVFTYNYNVNITLNNQGNILTYEEVDLDTSQLLTTTFEYTNGNMTKLISSAGKVLEISYDTKKSFHTYESRFPRIRTLNEVYDVAGLLFVEDLNIYNAVKYIPKFYDFVNKNNPTEYKINGNVVMSFQYEYNSLDYPRKITIPQNNMTIDLEYEAVE